jgi:hypothetical protein
MYYRVGELAGLRWIGLTEGRSMQLTTASLTEQLELADALLAA